MIKESSLSMMILQSCNRLFVILFLTIYCGCLGQVPSNNQSYDPPHRRFEYKYSYKGPYLAQKDGTVPFWIYEGSAIASEEMVRITPSLRSKKGSIWTKMPTTFDHWEIELWFRVNGRGRLGADGLAFWYTDMKYPEGPVYGSADNWRGLGIFFDSFDNDGKGNNPYIMAMVNDGSKSYDHQSDGFNQQMGGCLRDFRNKPFPVRAKIEYYKNVLTILFHSGNSNNEDEYEMCTRVENVFLPQRGYFGVSAATGGLADDHDVLKFLTYSLHVPGSQPAIPQATGALADQEKEKVSKEYELYKEKLEKQKADYFQSHPDEARKMREQEDMSPDHEYESLGEKELQQIFTGQSQIFDVLKNLNRKLDEIIGRQERTLSMVGSFQGAMQAGVTAGGGAPHQGGGPPPILPAPIQRHEVESLLSLQQELVRNSRDMKSSILAQANAQAQPASAQAAPHSVQSLNQQMLTDIRDSINVLRKDLGQIGTRVMAGGGGGGAPNGNAQPIVSCPTINCLSFTYFLVITSVQFSIVLGYLVYKSSKDSQSKKFY
ncbi:protein ERGIC-53-like [Panonychus citri]|uniref:protein ERGIC-53-like n=1 Tax=Panonychus citri TaxID=50023 RepID=UPI0023071D3D|nr:protein ERGIC-53-like [Panonychus citri]